jgi:hypothetical protein
MNPKFSAAERKIFHRLLNGHKYGGNTSSGISRGIPGSDFMETLGGFSSNPGTFMQRAGTIMHELGHNLGLRHGGIDHENYKPNHLSIMSYLNQFDWLIKNGSPLLDYDRFDLADLNEANLNEATGLDNVGNDGALANYGVRWVNNGQLWQKTTGANQNVDWNTNSTLNTSTSVDLNGSGTISVLRGRFVEWDNIIYDGGDIGVASKAEKRQLVTHPSDLIELNAEDYEWMQRNKREVR